MKWKVVFFDFDGVILDSVDVKTKAFAEMFKKYGASIQKKVVKYHLENGGVDRYKKFKYFYENLLNLSIDDKKIQELAEQFSNLAFNKVLKSDYIAGAYEVLVSLNKNNIPAFVVSGTPDLEIKSIVEKKGLSIFFIEVHGSPRNKTDITKDILNRYNYNSGGCIFLGDSMSDYQAALENGMDFLGIVPVNGTSPFPETTRVSNKVTL